MATITKDLGIATAYGYAKSKGYTGTEEEFAQDMLDMTQAVDDAQQYAQDAEDAKDDAQASAQSISQSLQQIATNTAELVDIRVSADGTAYDSAGAAVRGQVGNLQSDLSEITKHTFTYVSPTWEQGGLNTSGETTNSKVIRTGYINIANSKKILVDIPSGFTFGYFYYDAEYTRLTTMATSNVSQILDANVNATYIRFILSYNPTAVITPDKANCQIRLLSRTNLAYDIYPTGDTTNRTVEIRNFLQKQGMCHLAPGDYYIGTLSLPAGSKLIGCGNATRLIKNQYASNLPFAVRCNPDSEIASLQILGQETDLTPSEIGETNGIYVAGSGSNDSQRFRVNIHDVTVLNCTGAGIAIIGTGYNPQGGCHVSDAFIRQCGIGVHLGQYAEFHRVRSVSCNACYIGTLNNGGNNVFTNCDFSSNTKGILMDNTDDTMGNNSHGTFAACTVNHTDNNEGTAVEVINMHSGEIFSDMQIFYGGITLTNCSNIHFANLNCGTYTPITIDGGNLTLFSNSIFRSASDAPITVSNNDKVHFNACYYRDGTQVNA